MFPHKGRADMCVSSQGVAGVDGAGGVLLGLGGLMIGGEEGRDCTCCGGCCLTASPHRPRVLRLVWGLRLWQWTGTALCMCVMRTVIGDMSGHCGHCVFPQGGQGGSHQCFLGDGHLTFSARTCSVGRL